MSLDTWYGTSEVSADGLRDVLETRLGVAFESRDSHFLGTFYAAGDHGTERFVIMRNDGAEEDLLYPEFRDYAVLLEVTETARPDAVHGFLTNGLGLVPLEFDS